MTTSIMPSEAPALENIQARPTDGMARKFLFRILRKLKYGQITVVEDAHRYIFGQACNSHPLEAVITVHHPRFYGKAVLGGSIGTAEAYMNGLWSADHLTTALRIMALNRESFERLDKGWSKVSVPFHWFWHFLRKNTRSGSRKNIVAHYDLGNDFYRLFLDETLTYSCGIFDGEDGSMQQASLAKYERICRKLELGPQDDVMEIGSGWGGFAIYAAQNFGCRVTTATISEQQFDLAQQRIAPEAADLGLMRRPEACVGADGGIEDRPQHGMHPDTCVEPRHNGVGLGLVDQGHNRPTLLGDPVETTQEPGLAHARLSRDADHKPAAVVVNTVQEIAPEGV